MNLMTRIAAVLGCALFLSACLHYPGTVHEGEVTIEKVTKALACELAAVASKPKFKSEPWKLGEWGAKATLELTVVSSGGVDGGVTLFVPYVLAPLGVTPKLGVSLQDTSIAHVEYYI